MNTGIARVLMAPACLGLIVAGARADQRNLVLHRSYEYWPKPSYSYCTDDGDATQLTLDPRRHCAPLDLGGFAACQPGLQVVLHDPVKHGPLWAPTAVHGRA